MNSASLLASGMDLGMGLAVAAIAIGITARVALLLKQGKQIFPRH
jgi:hypothetical protein